MSTYYRPSEPIALSKIEEIGGIDIIYKDDINNPIKAIRYKENHIHFALNRNGEVIDLFRYGRNDAECILEFLKYELSKFDENGDCYTNLYFISEYDEEYYFFAHEDTGVIWLNLDLQALEGSKDVVETSKLILVFEAQPNLF